MSDNKDKFKLKEDPEVSGGAAGLTWSYCPLCSAKLRDASCPYCDIEYPEAKVDNDYDSGYQQEIEVQKRRPNSSISNRISRKTRRNDW